MLSLTYTPADVARVLVAHAPAAAAARDTNGDTPLSLAAARGHDAAALQLTLHSPKHAYLELQLQGARAGLLVFELDEEAAPRACANFVALCDGFKALCYRGSTFHRLLPGQVLQGGRLGGGGAPRSIFGGAFKDERAAMAKPLDRRGLLCMANSGPDTNGTQFFITLAPTPHLQGSHVCFGRLVAGARPLQNGDPLWQLDVVRHDRREVYNVHRRRERREEGVQADGRRASEESEEVLERESGDADGLDDPEGDRLLRHRWPLVAYPRPKL